MDNIFEKIIAPISLNDFALCSSIIGTGSAPTAAKLSSGVVKARLLRYVIGTASGIIRAATNKAGSYAVGQIRDT